MPKPIPKPPRAEEVLAAVAARYPAGSTVTGPMIAEVSDVNLATAGQIRQWARAHGAGRSPTARELAPVRSGPSARRA